MEGGAARMAELTSEHNEEHFSSFACANPVRRRLLVSQYHTFLIRWQVPGAGAENA